MAATILDAAGSRSLVIKSKLHSPQVPAWFGHTHRQAVLDAAAAAGLNVLSLVNSHAAAALQFGIERNFANKTEHVVFYDMGSSSTEVSAQPRSATKVLKVL